MSEFELNHGFWRRLSEHVPGQDIWRLRELIERYPPMRTETGYDFAPFLAGAAAELGVDPVRFADGFRASQVEMQVERAAAVEAAEGLLRGGG